MTETMPRNPRIFPRTIAVCLAVAAALALTGCARDAETTPGTGVPGGGRLLSARPFPGVAFTLGELGLEMRAVPAGTFRMGSLFGEPGRTAAEGPTTMVTLSRPYWLGRTPVTLGQWRAVMGTDLAVQAQKAAPGNAELSNLLAGADDGVAMYLVSWGDAVEFCARLNARARAEGTLPAGYEFSLPTEAQWEYACRAGTTGANYAESLVQPGTNLVAGLDDIAWHAGNSFQGYRGPPWGTVAGTRGPEGQAGPRAVGLKAPNALGLCDMLGNVYEWCRDRAPENLPGGEAWSSPDGRSQFIGFRLALTPVAPR
jgi:sulfatase modifying factor 1